MWRGSLSNSLSNSSGSSKFAIDIYPPPPPPAGKTDPDAAADAAADDDDDDDAPLPEPSTGPIDEANQYDVLIGRGTGANMFPGE